MTAPLRRAGCGVDATGAVVVWSVAEGRRGRRWREVRVDGRRVVSSLLLETDRDGRFSHTELNTPSGLLTLHPEGDGTIHGNTVGEHGVGHVAGLPWDVAGVLLVESSPIAAAAAAHRLCALVAAGASVSVPGIVVGLDLSVAPADVDVARPTATAWRFASVPPVELDADGLPLLGDGRTWPLEDAR